MDGQWEFEKDEDEEEQETSSDEDVEKAGGSSSSSAPLPPAYADGCTINLVLRVRNQQRELNDIKFDYTKVSVFFGIFFLAASVFLPAFSAFF